MLDVDVVVLGAGAAGLFCAGIAGQLGLKVLVIDHSVKVAEKVRISGGGRCNFTNRDLDATAPQRHFLSDNPQFCRSALSRYLPQDFIDLVRRHGIPFHEKHRGQLFGDRSSDDFIGMLLRECAAGGVERWQPCRLAGLRTRGGGVGARPARRYELDTDRGSVACTSVVVATGGLSIPKIGASDLGYRLARQFDVAVVEPRPGLVPLTLDGPAWQPFAALSGVALPVTLETGTGKTRMAFSEDLLFTHHGLSGPAGLQISSYWKPGSRLVIDLLPGQDVLAHLRAAKVSTRKMPAAVLAALLPSRLASAWVAQAPSLDRAMPDLPDRTLEVLARSLQHWELTPSGTEGYRKAEVTVGGVDTRQLSSRTMESRQPGLYFIGEVVDVTGWLGGYNFQWAWSSGHACAQALAADLAASKTG